MIDPLERELFSAIETIRKGKLYVSALLRDEWTTAWLKTVRGKSAPFASELSLREREVVNLFGQARSKKDIADLLCISIHTVEHHRANILKKLNLRTTADLVRYAVLLTAEASTSCQENGAD